MKPVNVRNITLQFDSSEDVTEEVVNKIIELVNNTLSDANHFEEPQIIKQNDTTIQVIDLKDE